MLTNLSPQSTNIWDFYNEYFSQYGEFPTYRTASKKLWISVGKIHFYVQELKGAGFFKQASNWGIFVEKNSVNIFKILWKVSCGYGKNIEDLEIYPYDDFYWELEIPTTMIKEKTTWYVLVAEWESMEGDKIFDGDYLIVKNQTTLNPWEVGVFSIKDGFEEKVLLKRFVKTPREIVFYSSNKTIPPIILSEQQEVEIKGKLVWVMRNFNS